MQAVHRAQGRDLVQRGRLDLRSVGKGKKGRCCPSLKGYENSGGNFNKGKGTFSKVFNWTALKATKKLHY